MQIFREIRTKRIGVSIFWSGVNIEVLQFLKNMLVVSFQNMYDATFNSPVSVSSENMRETHEQCCFP
jgi:hypothetical protein